MARPARTSTTSGAIRTIGSARAAATSGRLTIAGSRHRDVVELRRREERRDGEPLRAAAPEDPEPRQHERDEDREPPRAAVPCGLEVAADAETLVEIQPAMARAGRVRSEHQHATR